MRVEIQHYALTGHDGLMCAEFGGIRLYSVSVNEDDFAPSEYYLCLS